MTRNIISSLEDFHRVLRDHYWNDNFLFRGEDSADYIVRPKYGRFQADNPANDEHNERELLTEFKRRATPFIRNTPENDWEWMAVAQHFGLATRLLDWTENPLIAAYFATIPVPEPRDRMIYILNEKDFLSADETQSPFDIVDIALYRPKHISPRISAQSGVFTVHSVPSRPIDATSVEKWIIPNPCAIEINVMLDTYGIHEAFVFPEADGLARYLNERYRH